MSTTNTLERDTLKEKLLQVLRNDNLVKIIDLTEHLIRSSGKMDDIIERINTILEDKVIDKRVYWPTEWAAAYIIAHEYDTLEKLVEMHENSFMKQKYNQQLADKIRNIIHSLNGLIDESANEIKKTSNEDIYDFILDKIVQTDSIIQYLVSVLDKIDKEYQEAREAMLNSKEEIKKTILGVLDRM
jgi:hypothetical protein